MNADARASRSLWPSPLNTGTLAGRLDLAHRKVVARCPRSRESTLMNEGSQLYRIAEFHRLEHLVYASIEHVRADGV
jgi:hypothetical protein